MDEDRPGPPGDKRPTLFISYAHADRDRIDPLTRVLTDAGLQLWWDALIEGGAAFAKTIESALDLADAVVVAWSVHSVASDWVRDEAAHGRDRGRLVPISLDGAFPPLGFRQYHFIDFTRWQGSAEGPEIRALLSAIAAATSAQRAAPRAPAMPAPAPLARRRVIGRRALMIGAAGGTLALGGGLAAWRLARRPGAPDTSIAVLPFANLSGDPGQVYFSDGLAEELRAKLAEAGGFKVAAQTSSDHFRNHDQDAVTIGQQLGVAWLLDGSVRRAGNTLRISSELIETQSGLSKWSNNFDRQISDVFAVQSEIALTVIQAVTGQIPAAAAGLLKSGTGVVAAYDAFLRGRAFYDSDGEDADHKALASFDTAIAADPNYAQAHAMRAQTLLDIASEYAPAAQLAAIHADALASARRAVELAPKYAYAVLVLGEETLYSRHDFRAARQYFDKAHMLGPQDPDVLGQFAYFAARAGRIDEGLAAIERKIDLDRLNPVLYAGKGQILYCARRYAESARVFGQALEMNPTLGHARSGLGFSLMAQGELAAARTAFVAEPVERPKLTGLAIVDHRLGAAATARDALATMQRKFGDASLYPQALVLAQWRDVNGALDALERARAGNTSGLTWALTEPLLDPLRGQPRLNRLLASMGLT